MVLYSVVVFNMHGMVRCGMVLYGLIICRMALYGDHYNMPYVDAKYNTCVPWRDAPPLIP